MNHELNSLYSARRERQLAALFARRREAAQTLPGLAPLEKQYRAAQVRRGLALRDGDDAAAEGAQREAEALLKERAALLVSAGFPPDFLDLQYDCPLCKDSGYLENGKPCACLEKAILEQSTKESNLARLREERFDTWDLSRIPEENGQRAASEKLKAICEEYAESFPQNDRLNLLLLGGTGLGKSFALHCVGGRVLERGFSVRKLTAHQFFQMMLEEVIRNRDYTALRQLERVDLLILDDLGSEPRVSDISETSLYTLLDERTMAGKHTLFASNLSSAALAERYGERTASRLLDPSATRTLRLRGKDLRLSPAPAAKNGAPS